MLTVFFIQFSEVVDNCESSPFQIDGTCIDRPNGFTCECLNDFTGVACQLGKLLYYITIPPTLK